MDIILLFFAYTESMTSQDPRHRVYMSFQCRNGWHCQFLEQDLKTPLPRKLHFASRDKVIELVERGGGLSNLVPLLPGPPVEEAFSSESPRRGVHDRAGDKGSSMDVDCIWAEGRFRQLGGY